MTAHGAILTPKDHGYWFDEAAASNAVDFFPRYLRLTGGEWFNRPFVLSPWQEHDIIRPLFGWKRPDGTRRYRRCYVWVPRKNGKSELAAGVAFLELLGDAEQGGQVFSIATSKDQASIVFDKATDMLKLSPDLQEHLVGFKSSLFCAELGAAFRPLAGIPKGKHGLSMSGLIGDEVHEWTTDRLYQFVHQSSAARRQPLEFMISTAGEQSGYGWECFKMCEAILAGEHEDPETMVVIYRADAEKDKRDPDYWKSEEARRVANPNYRVSVKSDYLEAECKKAQRLPRLENDYKRYHLGLWVEQATRWLPMDAWGDCGQAPEFRPELRAAADEERPVAADVARLIVNGDANERWKHLAAAMKGRQAFAGIDLSSVADLTALVWIFAPEKEGELWTVIPRFFVPEVAMKIRSARDKVPYDHWAKIGALIPTKGNAVDYAYLKRQLFEDAEQFQAKSIAVDRWNATQITIEIRDEGLDAKLFGQGFASMSAPAKAWENLILRRDLDHGGHPVLTWCARNAAVQSDAAGNIKPSKEKSTERIDGIVGGVMALGAQMESPKEPDLSGFIANPVFA
jgi:phage terminase large subunit-like protein